MRKILLMLIFTLFLIGCTENVKRIPEDLSIKMSLIDFSKQIDIPMKKLNSYFELKMDTDRTLSFIELNISLEQMKKIVITYNNEKIYYLWNIVLTGMSIVFISLSIIAVIISLFKHIHLIEKIKNRQMTKRKTNIKRITAVKGITTEGAIAAITAAVFLHEQAIEEDFKLLLNWRRAKISNWKTSGTMPNNEYYHKGRGY